MDIIRVIKMTADEHPDRMCFVSRKGSMNYGELWRRSGALSFLLSEKLGSDKRPVPVYGHKEPGMVSSFIACIRSGRAYAPLDVNMPADRIADIVNRLGSDVIVALRDIPDDAAALFDHDVKVIRPDQDETVSGTPDDTGYDDSRNWIEPGDIHYIIFTSGSTGKPKGVEISNANLAAYLDWSQTLVENRSGVFMNQAPFSFDLSVMDLYTGLITGSTICAVDRELQKDVPALLEYIEKENVNYFVSTPSFADVLLSDTSFDGNRFGSLRKFLFCGETLTKRTAEELIRRFPGADVINTYGPTETTVCITSVRITEDMLDIEGDLPIGMQKPGTDIKIIKEDGSEARPGEPGEIVIYGDTVSPGYFRDPEKTGIVFEETVSCDGVKERAYHTGDLGHKDEQGMLYYEGRMDNQIKLHGYRIELGDIESNLEKIENVVRAQVLPVKREGKIQNLAAFIAFEKGKKPEDTYENRKMIRSRLREMIPGYMVPKKIIFIDEMPLTQNGKCDRKALAERL